MTQVSWVAGAAGFIGSHLCDALLGMGHQVIGLDNLSTGRIDNLKAAQERRSFQFVHADICDALPKDLPTPTRIWNLASPASPPHYQRLQVETLLAGALGSHNLLEAARRAGARYLLASTSEVYGDPLVNPQSEDYWGNVNPVGERSMYDEAKRFAEALVMAYARTKQVDARIARIFNTYGPRMALDDGRVVPNFLRQALAGEPLTVYGDGSQTRSFCYVDDTVDGLLTVMESKETRPVNLGNPEERTILDFARRIQERFGGPSAHLEFRPLPADDPRQRRPDIARAQALGWSPRIGLDVGLARTREAFLDDLNSGG